MPNKKVMTYAAIVIVTLILADRLKSLPGLNKLPTV